MGDSGWWWLTFCDRQAPKGRQFLGACVVRAVDIVGAAKAAHALGINPGGEVRGISVPADRIGSLPQGMRERLLTREEAEGLGKGDN